MIRKNIAALIAATSVVFAMGNVAAAATVTIVNSTTFYSQEADLLDKGGRVETFEGRPVGEIGPVLNTQDGAFEFFGFGGVGTGGSVVGEGVDPAIRTGNVFGRINTTEGGNRFLDSNDTFGFEFVLTDTTGIDFVQFAVTDHNDQGGRLHLFRVFDNGDGTVNDVPIFVWDSALGNGVVDYVQILLPEVTAEAWFLLAMVSPDGTRFVTNDGFGIDDLAFGRVVGGPLGDPVAPVPLPAAAWMMIAALGGLGILGRNRKKVA